jgi:hypothetical protein
VERQQDLGVQGRVGELLLRERPPRPVGGLLALVERLAELALADGGEAVAAVDRAAAEAPGGGEGVEDRLDADVPLPGRR